MKCLLLAIAALTGTIAHAQERVAIAWSPGAEIPQISVATDRGMWKAEGLDVSFVGFASGRESFEALMGGQVEFAFPAEFPAVTGAMRQQKFGVLAAVSRYRANRIIAAAPVPLARVADLAGKKIGVTLGTNTHFAIDGELQRAGVKGTLVNVSPADLVPALARGDIEAAMMFPSFYGQAKKILDDRYRELRISGYATTFILLGSANAIEKRQDVTAKVLKVLLAAEAIVAKEPAAAQQAAVKVVGRALTPELVREFWPDYEHRTVLDRELLDLFTREGQWIRERGLIKDVTPNEALFRSVIKDAPLRALDRSRVTVQ